MGFSNNLFYYRTLHPILPFFGFFLSQSSPWMGIFGGSCTGTPPKICIIQTHVFGLVYSSRVQLQTAKGDDKKYAKEEIGLIDFNQHRFLEGKGRNKCSKQKPNKFFSIHSQPWIFEFGKK